MVFLTGQGPISPPVPTGEAASSKTLSRAALPFAANIGGTPSTVHFLGLVPGFVGLSQANIQIPTTVTPGPEVVIFLTVGGQASNTATIAVR